MFEIIMSNPYMVAAIVVFFMFVLVGLVSCFSPAGRYPDGRCYICRKGVAHPGETCPKCGEDQPV